MKTRVFASAVVASVGIAAAASGQSFTPDTTVTLSLSWSELDRNYQPVAHPNGVLEPGERAFLRIDESFSNQNTIGHFSPPIGTFSQGTIRGFGSAFIDLAGFNGAEGAWNVDPKGNPQFGVNPSWDLAGAEGTPAAGGAYLANIAMGQFPPEPHIMTTNPVPAIWTGAWTPDSFNPRSVGFAIAPNPLAGRYIASVLLKLNNVSGAVVLCQYDFGSVSIPIVPAPAALAPILVAALTPRRRRARR